MSKYMQSLTSQIVIAALMASLVCVSTLIIRIPVFATGGYINIGDVLIFVSSLIFGARIGGFAGGVGSAIADIIGYPVYAPITIIVKGLEGYLAGVVSNQKNPSKDLLAVLVGGSVMILGYYLAEAYILGVGPYAALVEVPGNVFQIAAGGIIGIPLSLILRRYLT